MEIYFFIMGAQFIVLYNLFLVDYLDRLKLSAYQKYV